MLGIILKIASILGRILLILLLIVLVLLLIVLFWPISYRIHGIRDGEKMELRVRVKWLFGLVRAEFVYPSPGSIVAKLLWFPILDTAAKPSGEKKSSSGKEAPTEEDPSSKENSSQKEENSPAESSARENSSQKEESPSGKNFSSGEGSSPEKNSSPGESSSSAANPSQEKKNSSTAPQEDPQAGQDAGSTKGDGSAEENKNVSFRQKLSQIGQTLKDRRKELEERISVAGDKAKKILDQLQFYLELLQEEDSRILFAHVLFRLGRILKSIRPRKIKGEIYFGTGSPDTTGYCMAVYGMLLPSLGNNISVTPDFEHAVLTGELFVRGRITVLFFVHHGLRVLLDRRLHSRVKKIRKGRT